MSDLRSVEIGPDDAQLRLATALAGADNTDDVARALTKWGPLAAEAEFANLALLSSDSNALSVEHPQSLDSDIAERWTEISIDTPTPLCDAVLSGEPVLLGRLDDYVGRYAVMLADTEAAGLEATASLPLLAYGGTGIGAVGFGWSEPQSFSSHQLSRLRLIAGLTAQALQQVTSPLASPVAMGMAAAKALQEIFLPSVPPLTANLVTAAAYLPASSSAMGGDWFDAFPVETGTCLVVGDIGGHGLQAAGLMAEVRSAIRAFAVDDPSPARVVSRVNRMLCKLHSDSTATLIVGVWTPMTRTWLRCNAGHPPALRCRYGETTYLTLKVRDVMLGTDPDWLYHEEAKVLRPGTTLLMYTDGLVELAQQGLTVGMDGLLQYAETLSDLAPQAVVDDVLLWRLSRGPINDDLCLLAVRLK
jgi:hypothetical protein